MASKQSTQRNPERTRRRILQVAIRQFSARGFHGVSVDQIVAAARVNKRMVYHYFDSKEGLYEEVLHEVYQRIESTEFDAVEAGGSPREKLIRLLEGYFAFLDANPEFTQMLQWENLEKGKHIAKRGTLSKNPFLTRFREIVDEGMAKGEFRSDLDVAHLLIHFIGLCFIYHSNRFSLSQSLNMNLSDPKVRARGLEQVLALVFDGVASR